MSKAHTTVRNGQSTATSARRSPRKRSKTSAFASAGIAGIATIAAAAVTGVFGLIHLSAPQATAKAPPARSSPAAKSPPASTPPASPAPLSLIPGDNTKFIRDVTFPDHSRVKPGQHFIKKWEIKNTGTAPWVGRLLIPSGPATGACTYPTMVSIPATNPGHAVVISVPVVAAATQGVCYVTWKMATSSDKLYFPGFAGIWFLVNVS